MEGNSDTAFSISKETIHAIQYVASMARRGVLWSLMWKSLSYLSDTSS